MSKVSETVTERRLSRINNERETVSNQADIRPTVRRCYSTAVAAPASPAGGDGRLTRQASALPGVDAACAVFFALSTIRAERQV